MWSPKFHSKLQFIFPAYYIPQYTISNSLFYCKKTFVCLNILPENPCTLHLALHGPGQNRRTTFDMRACRRFIITSVTAARKCGKWRKNEYILCLIFWNILIFWLFWCKIRLSGALVSSFFVICPTFSRWTCPFKLHKIKRRPVSTPTKKNDGCHYYFTN